MVVDGAGRGFVRLRTISIELSTIELSTYYVLGLLLPVYLNESSPSVPLPSVLQVGPAQAQTWEAEPLAVKTVQYCD